MRPLPSAPNTSDLAGLDEGPIEIRDGRGPETVLQAERPNRARTRAAERATGFIGLSIQGHE
ncbi:hypothetical protein GCM10011491_22170 [Brucella endophytica]|uniref:Uncharacterized protein n=1 Tax=Brucella endophytica TaxID=1963359 RepID=A0A916WFW1_9HYPH|nr:hypothetical protein GCM10011491_22170 [Brucella endophytica]